MSRAPLTVISRRAQLAVASSVLLATAACSSGSSSTAKPPATPTAGSSASATTAATPSSSPPSVKATTPPPPPASVHANELGLVPVLMYHRLVAHPASDYERTPAQFLADLTYLEKNNFYPITTADLVAGKIDIPAGKHPVVLTFDDGTVSQFELGADGLPKPGTAVALMQAFAASHPDFPAIGSFYVNQAPFGTAAGEQALPYLSAHGDEVGVHTVHHYALSTKSDAVVQSEIAENLTMINKADPDQKVTTMALPFGNRPKVHSLAETGSSGGVSYHLDGVLAVGAGPSHSPYNAAFNPAYIPRIRAEDQDQAKPADRPYISSYLLPQLVANKSMLYTSDGNPEKVSYPKGSTIQVAPQWKSLANPY